MRLNDIANATLNNSIYALQRAIVQGVNIESYMEIVELELVVGPVSNHINIFLFATFNYTAQNM